ncbi:MAG: CPBP family intramembrane metalloprotease [Planctomycetaceae bacterium]|jgi:membrane protease YdiL (CAAX protease family)|nr:CPBP family intramembrane metalloprotease [Planctomycetaceae bacterium]
MKLFMGGKIRILVLISALIFPSLLTFVYFVLLSGESGGVQRLVYGAGKIFQFLIPIIFIFFLERQIVRTTDKFHSIANGDQNSGKFKLYYLGEGIFFGLFVFCAMFFLYCFCIGVKGGELAEGSAAHRVIVDKVSGFGLIDWRLFFLLGFFYSVIHSGLEEYYWRWFVFGKLRVICGVWTAIIISGLGFAAHHVILLHTFFGLGSVLCPLGSIAIAIGGIYWAWLYQRSGNLWGAWFGHGIIDAAIFLIGYMICFR